MPDLQTKKCFVPNENDQSISNTTFVDATDYVVAFVYNGNVPFKMRVELAMDAVLGSGVKWKIPLPAGASLLVSGGIIDRYNTGINATAGESNLLPGILNGKYVFFIEGNIKWGTTSGDAQLQIAKAANNVGDVTIVGGQGLVEYGEI